MSCRTLMTSLALMTIFSPSARAERWVSTVLLRQQNRLVTILHEEAGEPEEIRIDQAVYALQGVESAGIPGAFNYSADREGETVTILQDQILLSQMKSNPLMFSKAMHFHNADEVTCPRESNAILMLIQNPSAERIGNCLRLEKR